MLNIAYLQYVEEEKDGNIPLVPCDTLLLCGHLLLLLGSQSLLHLLLGGGSQLHTALHCCSVSVKNRGTL